MQSLGVINHILGPYQHAKWHSQNRNMNLRNLLGGRQHIYYCSLCNTVAVSRDILERPLTYASIPIIFNVIIYSVIIMRLEFHCGFKRQGLRFICYRKCSYGKHELIQMSQICALWCTSFHFDLVSGFVRVFLTF